MGARARISVSARWVSRRLRAFAATVSFTPNGAGGVHSFCVLLVIVQPPSEGRIPSWRLLRSKRGPVVYARNVKARRLAGRARQHFRRTDKPSMVPEGSLRPLHHPQGRKQSDTIPYYIASPITSNKLNGDRFNHIMVS